jgi:hypothetical protein
MAVVIFAGGDYGDGIEVTAVSDGIVVECDNLNGIVGLAHDEVCALRDALTKWLGDADADAEERERAAYLDKLLAALAPVHRDEARAWLRNHEHHTTIVVDGGLALGCSCGWGFRPEVTAP